uniref:Uncharacterized protein n=1 Tax=Lepeophtheirus salmonis TaxID=72036 RepID=A0A0K2UVD4_LEPSM
MCYRDRPTQHVINSRNYEVFSVSGKFAVWKVCIFLFKNL